MCPRYGRVSDFLRNDRAKAEFNPAHGGHNGREIPLLALSFQERGRETEEEKEEEEEEKETVPFSHFLEGTRLVFEMISNCTVSG